MEILKDPLFRILENTLFFEICVGKLATSVIEVAEYLLQLSLVGRHELPICVYMTLNDDITQKIMCGGFYSNEVS